MNNNLKGTLFSVVGSSSVASTYDLSESEMSKNTTILGIIVQL